MKTYTGTVKWYDPDEGLGFILVTAAVRAEIGLLHGHDLYVHHSGLIGRKAQLHDGDEVRFSVDTTPKGLRAINVVILTQATIQDLQRMHD